MRQLGKTYQSRKPKAYECFKELVKKFNDIPTLNEWYSETEYKRTTYYACKKIYLDVLTQIEEVK